MKRTRRPKRETPRAFMPDLACGIVGLPNVGKSTLFHALTQAGAASSNYPFCTLEPNVGVVDARLPVLARLSGSARILYASMSFVDEDKNTVRNKKFPGIEV